MRLRLPVVFVLLALVAILGVWMRREKIGGDAEGGTGPGPAEQAVNPFTPGRSGPTNRDNFRRHPAEVVRKGRGADRSGGGETVDNGNTEQTAEVYAAVGEGETLVTGGYRTADGRHEFTFLTVSAAPPAPPNPEAAVGPVPVRIAAKIVRIAPEALEGMGMEPLATAEQATSQHGEVWDPADAEQTLVGLSDTKAGDLLSAPTVVTMPGQPFALSVGDDKGNSFQLAGEVQASPGGGYAVRTTIRRVE